MVGDDIVCCGGAGRLPGVAPVLKLLLEQGGLIVLSQSAKHGPIRPALAFSNTRTTTKSVNLVTEKEPFKLLTLFDIKGAHLIEILGQSDFKNYNCSFKQ